MSVDDLLEEVTKGLKSYLRLIYFWNVLLFAVFLLIVFFAVLIIKVRVALVFDFFE